MIEYSRSTPMGPPAAILEAKPVPWYHAITKQPDQPSSRPRKPRRLPESGPVCIVTRRTGCRIALGRREEIREEVKRI